MPCDCFLAATLKQVALTQRNPSAHAVKNSSAGHAAINTCPHAPQPTHRCIVAHAVDEAVAREVCCHAVFQGAVPHCCHHLAALLPCSTADQLKLVLHVNLHTCRHISAQ